MSGYDTAHSNDETQFPTGARIGRRRSYSRMSWGSVLAGAVVAGASAVLLSLLGVAVGAGGLRFAETTASDVASYGLGAGIWTAVNLILSLAFGGYVAARLSGTHSHLDAELHGITVWAVALLFMTVLLTQAIGSILGTVASTASTAVGGASSLASAAANSAGSTGLLDQLQEALTTSGDPTQMTRAQITAEIASLAGRRVVNGSLTDQERARLTTLVAADAGISQDEAARRVARMEQDATTAVAQASQQARKVAETAAQGAAISAKALFSGLLLGLAGALVGAWIGTRHARVLSPHHDESEYEAHTTTTITHHAYDPTAEGAHHTVYEPLTTSTAPTSVRVYDDREVPTFLRSASFPMTKQELLRLVRVNNDDPMALRRLEQVPDRSYSSLNDLMSVLLTTA